jgi:N utilization substance protein B
MPLSRERRLGRERAVQALFSLESVAADELAPGLSRFWDSVEGEKDGAARSFAEELVRAVIGRRVEIDGAIQAQSANWRLERMARVDRNILRVATFEILDGRVPAKVAINGAIEVAKAYGSEASPAFVNGILDKVAKAAGKL